MEQQAARAAQPVAGKQPPGGAPADQDTGLTMSRIRFILGFGLKLVRLCPAFVAAYLGVSLLSQTAIPLLLPILLGEMTNRSQAAPPRPTAGPAAAGPEGA